MTEDEWREELLKLYDAVQAKKRKDEEPPDDSGGGVREPRRPRPQSPTGGATLPLPDEARARREADVQSLGNEPKFLERVGQAIEFFESKGVN